MSKIANTIPMRFNYLFSALLFLSLGYSSCTSDQGTTTPDPAALAKAKADSIAALPRAQVLVSTRFGDLTLELYNETPLHRDNFLRLVSEGFYDSLLIHRVQPNFMIQGGDPNSRGEVPREKYLGTASLSYSIPAEIDERLIMQYGSLCGFHNNDPNLASHGSQFMLVHGQPLRTYQIKSIAQEKRREYTPEQIAAYEQYGGLPQYDGRYTIFGHILEGQAVLDSMVYAPTLRSLDSSLPDRPIEDIRLLMKVVREAPTAADPSS